MKRPFDKAFSFLCGFSCMFSVPFRFIKYIYFNLSFRLPLIALLLITFVLVPFIIFYLFTCGALYFISSLNTNFNNRTFYLDMIENYRINHDWELVNKECAKERIEFIQVFHQITHEKKLNPNVFKSLKLRESQEVGQPS